ncbi:hypothetical protein CCUS01_16264 [Colletotrichum cuscutae]|uniref:Uncharacterized protein n=1 Tax=Colletotrichum cuscutae TaxID=1209917 RepID=A0AAI9Y6U7_9PEZI|nr:hypothetical protein CCUS01_16264 [Colletotrichum cuscutae]
MLSFNAIIALMGLAAIVNGAPTDNTVTKRLDDIKNCYCGRDTGSALVSDPTSTKNACPDYGTVGGPYPTKCQIMIDINEPLFVAKCKALGQPTGWCEE